MHCNFEPDAIRIDLKRDAIGTGFEAHSPDWPQVIACGERIPEAVTALLLEIEGTQPLSQATVDALDAVGGAEAVKAWDATVRGSRCLWLRDPGEVAVRTLQEFLQVGFSVSSACAWAAIRVRPDHAAELQRLGMDADAFAAYAEAYGECFDEWDWGSCWEVPSAEEWALAQVPLSRVYRYVEHGVSIDVAVSGWEPLIGRTSMPDDRLGLYLTLGFSPCEAAEHELSAASGVDVDAALRTLHALTRRPAPHVDPPF